MGSYDKFAVKILAIVAILFIFNRAAGVGIEREKTKQMLIEQQQCEEF